MDGWHTSGRDNSRRHTSGSFKELEGTHGILLVGEGSNEG